MFLYVGKFPERTNMAKITERRILAVHCMQVCGSNTYPASRLLRQLVGIPRHKNMAAYLRKWAETYQKKGTVNCSGGGSKMTGAQAQKAAQIFKAGYKEKETGLILDFNSINHALSISLKLVKLQRECSISPTAMRVQMERVCPSLRLIKLLKQQSQ